MSSGTRWALMQRYDIPDLLDPTDIYLTRWRIVQTPWFGIFLHAIRRPDNDRHLHDHPWSFITLILRGGYIEHVPATSRYGPGRGFTSPVVISRTWHAGTIHRLRAEDLHAIARLDRQPTWTLMLVGRRRRDWGYVTERGWVQHEQYHHNANPEGFPTP